MASYIVIFGTLLSIHVLARQGLEQAFLKVWIPLFLLTAYDFRVEIPGLPDPNFMQAAILPILFVLIRSQRFAIRYGVMEIMLTVYVLVRVAMDFVDRGYWDAQNYAFYMLTSLVGPYLLGRYIISNRRMDIDAARMFVLIMLLNFPLFLYEARMGISPILKVFLIFFPDANALVLPRWGLYRIVGTFSHPILAGIMIIAVYRLHRWLSWLGVWDQPQPGVLGLSQRFSEFLPIAFKYQISIVLIIMALMTLSRGPWIGGIVGAALAAVGVMQHRRRWLFIFLASLLVGGMAGQLLLDAYITPEAGEVLSGEANTMLYRKQLIDEYKGLLNERLLTGWGLTTVPKVPGMGSVDNAYLFMALQHGAVAIAVFTVILLYGTISQVISGLGATANEPPIGFTFAGIYLMCAIAFATVYMGGQTEPMIFLLLGWGESIKNRSGPESQVPEDHTRLAPTAPPFRRVMY